MTFLQQSQEWYSALQMRNRKPVTNTTLKAYRSYLKVWVVPRVGALEVATFSNSRLKTFVSELVSARLSPKTIEEIVSVIKKIVASVVNEEGVPLYPRQWNHSYADIPIVKRNEQETPCATESQIERAVRDSRLDYSMFFALIAGTGMRFGEARAVRFGEVAEHTCWDYRNQIINVRTQFQRNNEVRPKTDAGYRTIEIPARLHAYLSEHSQNKVLGDLLFVNDTGVGPIYEQTARMFHLNKTGIPGFHSIRRFRVTHLRHAGVPEEIIRFWIGHSSSDITDHYSRLANNAEIRKGWVERAGLGFTLPKRMDNNVGCVL